MAIFPTNTPFAPVVPLFLEAADSDLQTFLQEAHALLESCPEIVELIDADLDRHALGKKALRVADAQWMAERACLLPGLGEPPLQAPQRQPLRLQNGRPRTPAYIVAITLLLRGYLGSGFKAQDVTMFMMESITLRVFFANLGCSMPGRSTLTELTNAVANETRLRILDAQVALALKLNLDDFTTLLQDSTHVDGNTKWPTDSRMIVALIGRLVRVGGSLDRVNLPSLDCSAAAEALLIVIALDREIDLAQGKKNTGRFRRRKYEKLLTQAKRVHKAMTAKLPVLRQQLADLDVLPSRKALANRAVDHIHADLDALATMIFNCAARVVRDEKVPMKKKILSISDPDVGFIAKGQRDPVIGYKPQISRSGAGFITGLLLPKGNAADSGQLVPMVNEVSARTGVTPKVVSVDDGYASAENVSAMRLLGIEVISINGAKGRAMTSRADWNSDEYIEARDLRSAVESLMFTLKQGFNFGEVTRRGLSSVHAELLEKALAYNLCHFVRLKRRQATEFARHARPLLAVA